MTEEVFYRVSMRNEVPNRIDEATDTVPASDIDRYVEDARTRWATVKYEVIT